MALKITGLDKFQRELEDIANAAKALDGDLTTIQYDPSDQASIDNAIAQVESAIDEKVAPYRSSPTVEEMANNLKQRYSEDILGRAAAARLDSKDTAMPTPTEEAAILRRIENAVMDLRQANYQTYGQVIKKLARQLHAPEIEAVTKRLSQDVDLAAWLKAADATQGGMVGSAKLEWPGQQEKEFGTIIQLIDRFASHENEAQQFSHKFYYVGSNITTDLQNMTRQLIVPFARDYVEYLKREVPALREREIPKPATSQMVAHPTHTLIGILTGVIGILLIVGGIFAIWIGSTSDTEIHLLGSSFKSSNVGVAMAFLGAALAIFGFRRLLTSVERITK